MPFERFGRGQDQSRKTTIPRKGKQKKQKTHTDTTIPGSRFWTETTTLHTYTCIPTTIYILGTEGNGDEYIPLGQGHFGQDVAAFDTPSFIHFPVSHTHTHYLSLSRYPLLFPFSAFPFSSYFASSSLLFGFQGLLWCIETCMNRRGGFRQPERALLRLDALDSRERLQGSRRVKVGVLYGHGGQDAALASGLSSAQAAIVFGA
ncbi:hypothetical protein HDV57DRAFT_294351 [Trichoderma longibrachiatum]